MKRILGLAAIACLFAGSALAQSATVTTYGDLWTSIQPTLLTILAALATGIIGFVAQATHQKAIVDLEAGHRDAIHTAIQTGLGLALSRFGEFLTSKPVDTKNSIINTVIAYVAKSVPDALKHFGMDDVHLSNMIESKLEQMLGLPSVPDAVAPVVVPVAAIVPAPQV